MSSSSIIMSHEANSTAAVAPPSDHAPLLASSSASQPILTSLLSNVVAPPLLAATVAPPPPFIGDAPQESAPGDNAPPHAAGASDDSGVASGGADSAAQQSTCPSQPPQRSIADYSSGGNFTTEMNEEATPLDSEEGGMPSSRRYPSRERRGTATAAVETVVEEEHSGEQDDLNTTNLSSALIENGIIISMKDPNYKAIMFSFFRKLGAISREKRDENEEVRVKEEAFNYLFQNSGGRFMNYVNYRCPHEGIVEVNEKTARSKIYNDIYRRLESESHWATGEEYSLPNDIILSLRDDNYRQVMYTAFQELGTDRDRDYDEEKRVKDAVFTLLKSSGGRFMNYRNGKRPEEGLIIVDEKTARQKISSDISRRLERKHLWNGVDLSSDISLPIQEKEAAVEEEEEQEEEASLGNDDDDGSDYEDDSNPTLSVQAGGNDIILSMRDANYKSIMFSFFQRLGALAIDERDRNEEKRVKKEAYALFKSQSKASGGRLMGYRNGQRPVEGLIEVDEKTAQNKISMDITRRLTSESYWAGEGASDPRRGNASKKQSARTKNSVKKVNKGAAVKGVGRSSRPLGDKIVSIRKSATKYSPPTKRVSSYPKRSKARVTFKDDEQYSVQKTSVAKRARSPARRSELHSEDVDALDADSYLVANVAIAETPSRDYKCGVCGLPKKGHKCLGNPSSWEESSTAVAQTPVRARSKSQPGLSAKSLKPITPTPKRGFTSSASGVAKSDRVHRLRLASCRECENCLREDCGECAMCEDKIKFGGRGTKRQKCVERRCLRNESLPAQTTTTNADNFQFTSPPTRRSIRSGTKRKAALAANLTIMNLMADDDLENKVLSGGIFTDSDEELAESQLFVKRAKFASDEEEMPSFEEISASEFNELIDLLQSSPLPQRKVASTELDWQGLHLADLSPIPVVPTTRVVKLDTSKPIILGPNSRNSAWSQRLIMTTEDTATTSSSLRGRTLKSNPRMPAMEPKTSESQQFESIMSPDFGDKHASIFSEDHKLIPYSPINLLPRRSSLF